MTDQIFHTDLTDHSDPTDAMEDAAQPAEARPEQVEVRRNVALSGTVGALAAVLTAAFALRALGDGSALDWALFAVLAAITGLHLAAVVDGRAPLLVADDLGVRLREGAEWQGIAWEHIECLEHFPRRLPFRDGHLLVVGESGQQLLVPLTVATRVVGIDASTISDGLAELADGRADVVEVVPGIDDELDEIADLPFLDDQVAVRESSDPTDPDPTDRPKAREVAPEETVPVQRRGIAAEVEKRLRFPSGQPLGTEPSPTPGPGRPVMSAARVEVDSTAVHPTMGANALRAEPVVDVVVGDEPLEHTLTVVLDDVAVQPAAEPVIGPELRGARERLRLTVDQLSDRTRIRPHVIEAIEVDDFGPCGGDFYARGHLRTLARVLGIDAAPLVETYDEEYAEAPVDPRRVFESELATGVGGSIRGTQGGRNWSVLLAAVMAAVLVWSIARLVMDGPVDLGDPSTLRPASGSGGLHNGTAVPQVPVTLTATAGGAKLLVRDGRGREVFDGQLAFGQSTQLKVSPPVRIWSSDGSVTAAVDCHPAKALGDTGVEVTTTLSGC